MGDDISTDPLATQLLQVARDFQVELPLIHIQALKDAAARRHRQNIDHTAQVFDEGTAAAPAAAPRDWAEARARLIVDQYRHLFRADAAAATGGMINVIAGELRAAEATMLRQADEIAEDMRVKLKALRAGTL
ncbi:hypothetical protein [Nitrospirillum amazonense]|uniref:hypothetical protein n=1 Tax=Nitrospirillum amazonense TaxID=28077 RepID=UPI00241246A1|nr:hypothetical protein [Nitrospirillum amazonense]MDG3444634.1 hypothetical protein [Nitrospirillum amazonense]